MKIRSAAKTHVGFVRTNNEDSYLCDDASGLYAVADGMGGHAAGGTASRLAIEALRNHNPNGHPHPREQLAAVFTYANEVILADARSWPIRRWSGTTMTALYLIDEEKAGTAYIAHVGDSRCYLIRDGIGRQLTRDHAIPGSHVILNCLGDRPGAHVKTDVITEQVRPGDVFILCSDGLSDYIDADGVGRFVQSWQRFLSRPGRSTAEFAAADVLPGDLASLLIQEALRAGGADNITVVVVAVEAD